MGEKPKPNELPFDVKIMLEAPARFGGFTITDGPNPEPPSRKPTVALDERGWQAWLDWASIALGSTDSAIHEAFAEWVASDKHGADFDAYLKELEAGAAESEFPKRRGKQARLKVERMERGELVLFVAQDYDRIKWALKQHGISVYRRERFVAELACRRWGFMDSKKRPRIATLRKHRKRGQGKPR